MTRIALACLLLSGCVTYSEPKVLEGHIWSRDYKAAWAQPVMVGKVASMVYHPAEWNVTVRYGGEESVVNDQILYERSHLGQRVRVQCHWPITPDSLIAGAPEVLAVDLMPR